MEYLPIIISVMLIILPISFKSHLEESIRDRFSNDNKIKKNTIIDSTFHIVDFNTFFCSMFSVFIGLITKFNKNSTLSIDTQKLILLAGFSLTIFGIIKLFTLKNKLLTDNFECSILQYFPYYYLFYFIIILGNIVLVILNIAST